MPTFTELEGILKQNQMIGYFHYIKLKLFDLLYKRYLIPEEYDSNKQVIAKKDIDPKYICLRQIHSNPKKVEIHDPKTDKVVLYPSIYKAALALDQNTGLIVMYNGRVWR